jgi:hypothetical protein
MKKKIFTLISIFVLTLVSISNANQMPEAEKTFFCIGEENLVYKRKKPSDCPSAMTAITREEFCRGNYQRKKWGRQEGYTDNAHMFFTEYCSTEEKKIALEKHEQKTEEDVKIESINPISKPEF